MLCEEDQFIRQPCQVSLTIVSLLLSYTFSNPSYWCGPPSNALYTSTQGAVNKIHSDVLASERLQSETACVHHLL